MNDLNTNKSIVIDKYWAAPTDSVEEGLAYLKDALKRITSWPSQILIVSAAEVKLLLNPLVSNFCQSLLQEHNTHLTFVSAACTSLHAAIFDFEKMRTSECLVILLELDQDLQQACLNALGVGNEAGQDGLTVKNCIGYCLLQKKIPQDTDITISKCDVFSQPKGMSGIQKLLNQLTHYINQSSNDCLFVSFDICSKWGKTLIKALKSRLKDNQDISHWLTSIEDDNQHYLSLKPLLELQLYQHKLANQDLQILTLGGGGRIGCLKLTSGLNKTTHISKSSFDEFNLTADEAIYLQSIKVKKHSIQAYHEIIKATLKYPQSQYRGINNHYFRWHQNLSQGSGVNQ